MAPPSTSEAPLPGRRSVIAQLIAFAIGLGLLWWCVDRAIEQGDWSKIRHADPGLVLVLLGCTIVSLVINGTTYWITIRPVKRLKLWDLQCLNLVSNMLNYAPVRLGLVARIAYHLRVDGLRPLQIAGWLAFVGYLVALTIGSCIGATLLRDRVDGIWLGLVLGQIAIGGLGCRMIVGVRLVKRYGQGLDRIVGRPTALWGALLLRLGDMAAYAGRMSAALAILGFQLHLPHIVILAVVAIAASMTPLGRVGFREWGVAKAGALLGL